VLTALVGVAVVVLVLAFVIAFARDQGPSPSDVALSYEQAWDGLDFTALWDLSGDELRDGLDRKEFVTAKAAAYAAQAGLGRLARRVVLEDARTNRSVAIVHTLLELRDGGAARNEIHLVKRAGRWAVVGYQLRADAPPASSA
jgi:hypothetical protein